MYWFCLKEPARGSPTSQGLDGLLSLEGYWVFQADWVRRIMVLLKIKSGNKMGEYYRHFKL
jgi:hypothetical protein